MTVGPFDPADGEAAFALNRRVFNSPADAGPRWIASLEHSICVGAWDGGRLAGFARAKPYLQWYGGRAVPMAGIASVSVAPEDRSRGLAQQLTAALLPLARDAGLAVSVLFPASTALYRGLGWEVAGHHTWVKVPARTLRAVRRPESVVLRPGTDADADAVIACYAELTRQSNGLLERTGPFFERPGEGITVAEEAGRVTGYAVTALTGRFHDDLGVTCWDAVGLTSAAQQALWWLLGSHASVVESVEIQTTPDTGLAFALPEPDVTVTSDERWMARVVDATAAVAARGWPAGVTAEVDLELADRQAPWHSGRHRLAVAGGEASLAPGGVGTVRLTPGGLGALYTAYADPWTLRRNGLLDTDDEDALRALATAFAGPAPHLLDYF